LPTSSSPTPTSCTKHIDALFFYTNVVNFALFLYVYTVVFELFDVYELDKFFTHERQYHIIGSNSAHVRHRHQHTQLRHSPFAHTPQDVSVPLITTTDRHHERRWRWRGPNSVYTNVVNFALFFYVYTVVFELFDVYELDKFFTHERQYHIIGSNSAHVRHRHQHTQLRHSPFAHTPQDVSVPLITTTDRHHERRWRWRGPNSVHFPPAPPPPPAHAAATPELPSSAAHRRRWCGIPGGEREARRRGGSGEAEDGMGNGGPHGDVCAPEGDLREPRQ
jgi:hypothetical protein